MLRQLAELVHVAQQGRHAAGTPLADAVQADGHKGMLDIGVHETTRYGLSKGQQVFLRQGQGGNDFIIQGLLHEGLDHGIIHGIQHVVIAAQVGSRHKGGVSTVQDAHLALLVGLLVIGVDDRHAAVRQGQFLGNVLGGFDDPQAEGFCRDKDAILIAQLVPNGLILSTGIAGHDTVHQGGGEHAGIFQPLLELFAQVPQLGQRHDALLQHDAVVVDQLHRQDDQALVLSIVEVLGTLKQQLGQLAGIGMGRAVLELVRFVQHNAGFRGVADDEAQRIQLGIGCILFVVGIGIHSVGHRGHHTVELHRLAIYQTTKQHGVTVVLLLKGREQGAHLDGLHQHDITIEIGLLVGNVDHVINKSAQEVTLTELQYSNRTHRSILHGSCETFHFISLLMLMLHVV